MKGKIKDNTHGLAAAKTWLIFIGFGVLTLLSPIVSPTTAAEPPSSNDRGCFAYAFTTSQNHLFLLESNKTAFGSNVTIKHNCEYIEVYTNGTFEAYSEDDQVIFSLDLGSNNIEIRSENYSKNITNVFIFPDRLSWEFEFYEWQNRNSYTLEEYIALSKAQAAQNWASILSIVVVFTLTTMVYWNLINSYIDRNYCEEVTN